VFILVMYFDDAFFACYFADLLGHDGVLFEGVNGFVAFIFVYYYAEAPAHVKGSKHFFVGYDVAEFLGGALDNAENGLRLEVVKGEADAF